MNDIKIYSIVVIFLAITLLLTTFIRSKEYKAIYQALYLGAVIAVALNLYFFLGLSTPKGTNRYKDWHLLLTVYLPIFLWGISTISIVIAKSFLRGDTPMNKWDADEAKELLLHEKNIFKRFLAYGIIAIDLPYFFLLALVVIGTLINYVVVKFL